MLYFWSTHLILIYIWDENTKTTYTNKNFSNIFYNIYIPISLTKNESV